MSASSATAAADSGHARTQSVQAVLDAVKAAKQREIDQAGKLEIMEKANERKADAQFNKLASEMRDAKGTKIQKAQQGNFTAAKADLVSAAAAKAAEREKLAEEHAIMAARSTDSTFHKLENELSNVVAEKEFKHNNAAAWDAINARKRDTSVSQLNASLAGDNSSKLRHVVGSAEDAAAVLKDKAAAKAASSSGAQ
jgi:hypothetical protein